MGNNDGSVSTRSLVDVINKKNETIAKLVEALKESLKLMASLEEWTYEQRRVKREHIRKVNSLLADLEAAEGVG